MNDFRTCSVVSNTVKRLAQNNLQLTERTNRVGGSFAGIFNDFRYSISRYTCTEVVFVKNAARGSTTETVRTTNPTVTSPALYTPVNSVP